MNQDFDPDVVRAVVAHMNEDHAEANLVIVRAHGAAEATAAAMSDFDSQTGVWTVMGPEGPLEDIRIPWPSGVVERREQVRGEVVALYKASCTALGLDPGHPA